MNTRPGTVGTDFRVPPHLAAAVADPSSVPLAEIPAVLGALEGVKATLWARLAVPAAPNGAGDHLLTIVEAAERLRVPESTKQANKTQAGDFLKERLAAIGNQTYVGPAADDVAVAELLRDLTTTYEIQHRASRRTLRGHVAALTEKLGAEKAVNVTLP